MIAIAGVYEQFDLIIFTPYQFISFIALNNNGLKKRDLSAMKESIGG